MPKRLYQLIALAILIGAPLIVRAVSMAVPGIQPAAKPDNTAPADQPVAEAPPRPSEPPSPPPARVPMDAAAEMTPGNINAVVDVTPSLDPQGITPAPVGDVASDTAQRSKPPGQDQSY